MQRLLSIVHYPYFWLSTFISLWILIIATGMYWLMGLTAGMALFVIGLLLLKQHHYPILLGALCITSAILLPSLSLSESLPAIRVEELLYYGFIPLFLLWQPERLPTITNRFLKWYGAFVILATFSWLIASFLFSVPTGSRDIVELVKMGKVALVVAFFSLFNYTERHQKALIFTLTAAIFISGLIGLFGHFGIAGVDRYIAPFYTDTHLGSLDARLFGTIGNPNSFSILLVIGILCSAIIAHQYTTGLSQLIPLFSSLFFVGLITLTGSRTGFMLMILSLVLIGTYFIWSYNWGYTKILGGIGIVLGVAGGALLFAPSTISTRLLSLTDILNDLSFQMRLLSWYLNGLIFWESPFIGWGPAKYLHPTVVDNEYLLMLRRYGMIAFPFYLSLYVFPLKQGVQYLLKRIQQQNNPLTLLIIGGSTVFLVANLTNAILMDIQLMDIWGVVLGVGFSFMNQSSFTNRPEVDDNNS